MTPDDPVTQRQPNPVRPFAAQIEEGMARWRVGYLISQQQRAVAEDRQAEEGELPREGLGYSANLVALRPPSGRGPG